MILALAQDRGAGLAYCIKASIEARCFSPESLEERVYNAAFKISPRKLAFRRKMYPVRIPYLIFFCLAACATSPQMEDAWVNKTLSVPEAQARFINDPDYCDAYAASLAPYPSQMGSVSSYAYMEAYMQAKDQRKQYFDACMQERGWSRAVESSR